MNERGRGIMQARETRVESAGRAQRALGLIALGIGLLGVAGCAPKIWAANAIQPSQPGDTKEVWIYLHTDDDRVDGVYRCYDGDQKPVCKRATLVTK